ncbi:protein of unknown function [Taphrina deformans PYCC 5710]|uniref:RAVE subunit 2/Rogdi n=1 Tax=Taphrina deformans (strain PYCC 5710 / ATCC 11124 / CBS 356.35 / IMI 108563 / JCM 9778 / NBRC 8474) TaxID=1097556 RepID=R4XFX2_TAPDE|nr:protein of unknown function [Taphrina deformans PYCC 5710]|eukprot:CCG84563.1 protein of unknown function [Taphrina deformans PYCC 5710]
MSLVSSRPEQDILALEAQVIRAERQWLFDNVLPRSVDSIREGLQECSDLLKNASITLPISSRETECLKGIMTRQGSQLVKGDLVVKLSKIHTKLSIPAGKHIHLQQIEDISSLVHYSMESLDHNLYSDTARRIIGDVLMNIKQALQSLTKFPSGSAFPLASIDPDSLRPDLPSNVALDLYIQDASLIAELRLLQARKAENFFSTLIKNNAVETGGFVRYRGEDVRVVEHIRVESQDPALIAITAKLTALKHNVEEVQKKINATQA